MPPQKPNNKKKLSFLKKLPLKQTTKQAREQKTMSNRVNISDIGKPSRFPNIILS